MGECGPQHKQPRKKYLDMAGVGGRTYYRGTRRARLDWLKDGLFWIVWACAVLWTVMVFVVRPY